MVISPDQRLSFRATSDAATSDALIPGASLIHWQSTTAQLVSLVHDLDFLGKGLGLAKFYWAGHWYGVTQCHSENWVDAATADQRTSLGLATAADQPLPGTILASEPTGMVVATAEGFVRLSGLLNLDGKVFDPRTAGLLPGKRLPLWSQEQMRALAQLEAQLIPQEALWSERLRSPQPVTLPGAGGESGSGAIFVRTPLPLDDSLRRNLAALDEDWILVMTTAFVAYALRLGSSEQPSGQLELTGEVGLQLPELRQQLQQPGLEYLLAHHLPYRLSLNFTQDFAAALHAARPQLGRLRQTSGYLRDLPLRIFNLDRTVAPAPLPILLEVTPQAPDAPQTLGGELTLALAVESQDCVWFYNPAVFSEESIAQFQRQFLTWLEALVQQPQMPLSQQPTLDLAQQQLLAEWNQTQQSYDCNRCVHTLFEAQVARTPDETAVRCGDRTLTYGQLNQRANQLARELRDRGVSPEDFVGLCVERSLEMIIGLMAILKAGGAYLPMDPTYPAERLALMVEDAEPRVILTQGSLLQQLPVHSAQCFCLDADWEAVAHHSPSDLKVAVQPHHLAYIIYTSGSTGRPKGVLIEHAALSNFAQAAQVTYGITGTDRVLQFASISFDAAAEEIYPCLLAGGELVLRTPEMMSSIPQFLQRCQDYGLTVLDLPTAYWHLLISELNGGQVQLPPPVRTVVIGGEAVNAERVSQWQRMLWRTGCRAQLINTYGPTETTVVATAQKIPLPQQEPSAERLPPVTIGRPLPNVTTYILDGQQQPVPLGVPGELYIGGAGLARGYLKRPQKTAAQFCPHPFSDRPGERLYRTGDLARYLANGEIEFLGRIDSQVKIRGFRIELGEIEALLSQQAQDVAVIVREDQPGQKRLVAYLVAKPDNPLSIKTLRRELRKKLPDHMIPAAFVLLDSLPMTPSDKVDRKALPEPVQVAAPVDSLTVALPQTQTQRQLAQLWEALLGIRPIGLDDNFFELGGDSLQAVKLFVQIERALGESLQLSTLFQAPTLRSLASILDGETEASAPDSAIPLKPSGSKPPLFFLNAATYAKQFVPYVSQDQPLYNLNLFGITERLVKNLPELTLAAIADQFIQDLRQIQPQGPYYLAGYCDDSKLAAEMAQQLTAAGETVGRLIFIDPMWDDPEGLAYHLDNLLRFGPDYLIAKAKERWKMFRDQQRLQKQLRQESVSTKTDSWQSSAPEAPQEAPSSPSLSDDVALYQHYLSLCHAYQARPYRGPVTVISSSELLNTPTPILEQSLVNGFELCEVKGYHHTIFHLPQRAVLVAQIEQALNQSLTDHSSESPESLVFPGKLR